jgi:hypothetical protein
LFGADVNIAFAASDAVVLLIVPKLINIFGLTGLDAHPISNES